ncbi:MAG: flavin reductase [Actinobacteria bacterium]|nr:flavin reductase [Actinomycetota bacterium]
MSEIAAADFRHVLGHLPTGVTVLTAHGADGPTGMAANSVTSVSLDPPLILVCPAKSSSTWPEIGATGAFCVNIMAEHHADLSRTFAMKDTDRFAGVSWHHRPTGPALDEAVAWIECRVRDEHDAGDHTIVVADVVAIEATEGAAPLLFFRGGFGAFRDPSV